MPLLGTILGAIGGGLLDNATTVDTTPAQVIDVEQSEAAQKAARDEMLILLGVSGLTLLSFGLLGYFIFKSR